MSGPPSPLLLLLGGWVWARRRQGKKGREKEKKPPQPLLQRCLRRCHRWWRWLMVVVGVD